jgi:nucleoside phosphorylase
MQTQPITIKDLQELESQPQFSDRTPAYFAGRCLLDALQFLRNDPKWPARSGHLVNAHAIRLCWECLTDLGGGRAKRIQSYVKETYERLRLGRNRKVPFFGDDFWDWAYILDAMVSVEGVLKDAELKKDLTADVNEFYRRVNKHPNRGLSLNKPGDQEWPGPAIPTAAHRLLRRARKHIEDTSGFQACLNDLKARAITPINNGAYLGRKVRPEYHQWHLGQVVAEFGADAVTQRQALSHISDIDELNEIRDQAYALARVVQGALAVGDRDNSDAALEKLYEREDLSRPLGTGIVGDHPKASMNALEALWPSLREEPDEMEKIGEMVDVLVAAHRRTNRIGILVALERERNACIDQFEADGAKRKNHGDVVEINHADYDLVILTGKAVIEAAVATGNLINKHRVTRVMMVGIAGSLGQHVGRRFKGPKIGDVVIATATAEYALRTKVRKKRINAPVPFNNSVWTTLPTDLSLFARAHEAGLKIQAELAEHEGRKTILYEGLIVTGNGIKDHAKEKQNILKERPGGLAVAEEGFPAALLSLQYGIPYLEIRGISDLAQGDKKKQGDDAKTEERDQNLAATNAAKVAVALTKSLSKSWQ